MRTRNLLIALFVVSLLFAGVISYYASSSPDGLEKVSEDHGISAQAKDHDLDDSPLADYGVSGVDNARLSGGLAGIIGVGVTFAVASGLVLVVRRRKHAE
jgi:cobalt/nickel transport protein